MEETIKSGADAGIDGKDADACRISATDENTRAEMTNILTLLDENSLLQVLLRTRAEDHNALRQTCRHFQSIIDSDLFRRERELQEWTQVEVHVLTAEEHYRETHEFPEEDLEELTTYLDTNYCALGCISASGIHNEFRLIHNKFRILVEGKVGGTGSFHLIERKGGHQFYLLHTCDTGNLFFDKKGRPRLPSIREAMDARSSSTAGSQEGYFMYLETFKLNPEHRQDATWVGAKAIRSLLLDSPLKDKWAVVFYRADAKAWLTEQDRQRSRDHRYPRSNSTEEMEEFWREKKALEARTRFLNKVDLRQFLRSGFQQAADSLQKKPCLYVFAVPATMRANGSMMSHKETMAAMIVDRTDLPFNKEMSPVDIKLARFMDSSCTTRRVLVEKRNEAMDDAEFQSSQAAALRVASACADLARHDSEVRAEVASLVGENIGGGASVNNSKAFHTCVACYTPEYMDLLFEFVPYAERRLALDKFDARGLTPLMAVALSPPYDSSLEPHVEMAEKLIGLGADNSISDVLGETALGKFRYMSQAMRQHRDDDMDSEHIRMEQLLRPGGGPTAADDYYLDDSDEDSVTV